MAPGGTLSTRCGRYNRAKRSSNVGHRQLQGTAAETYDRAYEVAIKNGTPAEAKTTR